VLAPPIFTVEPVTEGARLIDPTVKVPLILAVVVLAIGTYRVMLVPEPVNITVPATLLFDLLDPISNPPLDLTGPSNVTLPIIALL
jgi:hypothetical protein